MLKGRGSSVLAINALQIRQPSPPGRHTSLRVHSRRETCREWTYRIKNDNQGKNSGEYCSRTLACLLPAMVLCVAFVCKSGSERESDETATFTQLSSPAEPRGTRRWSPPSAWPSTADTAGSYSPGRG